jgi:methionine sulfoxide reductase heme-binding subunit
MSQRLLKPVVFILALVPGLWLVYRTVNGMLGANPVEDLLLTTGLWALRFLLISLAITPLRRVTGWNRVIQFRRMLGLFAFFYAAVHLTIYLVLDQGLDLPFILADIVKRRFITAGMAAYLLMLPLAVTSTKGWIRRLGPRWQRLHRLVYFSAIAAALHFTWKVKVIIGEPVYYAVALAILLVLRLLWKLRTEAAVGRQPAQA